MLRAPHLDKRNHFGIAVEASFKPAAGFSFLGKPAVAKPWYARVWEWFLEDV